jgi:hypothetical protein
MSTPAPEPATSQPSPGVNPRYVFVLALAAAAILVVGALLRPRIDGPRAPATMPEGELLRLAQLSQRRSLETEVTYFRTVATNISTSVVYLQSLGRSGVVWTEGRTVTARAGAREPGLAADGDGQAGIHGSGPIVAVQTSPPEGVTVTRAAGPPGVGDWVLAIWQTPEHRAVVPGHHVGTSAVSCGTLPAQEVLTTVPLSGRMAGAGLFDLAGGLIAVVLRCDERLAAVTPETVDAMLAEARTLEGRLRDLYGLQVAALSQAEAAHLGAGSGALVRAIWTGGAADRIGLLPGDVVVAVGTTPVDGPQDLAPLVAGDDQPPDVTVHRRSGRTSLPLSTAGTPEQRGAGPAGLAFERAAPGVRVEAVAAGSPAADAGLQPGDRILRINQQPVTAPEQIARLMSGAGDRAFVDVARGDRRLGVLVH